MPLGRWCSNRGTVIPSQKADNRRQTERRTPSSNVLIAHLAIYLANAKPLFDRLSP